MFQLKVSERKRDATKQEQTNTACYFWHNIMLSAVYHICMCVSVFANGLTYLLIQSIPYIDTKSTDCVFHAHFALATFLTWRYQGHKQKRIEININKEISILFLISIYDLIFYFRFFYTQFSVRYSNLPKNSQLLIFEEI